MHSFTRDLKETLNELLVINSSKANLDSILRLQKRAARVILNAPVNSRSVDLFNNLNWIPFYRESHIKQYALIYKRLKGNIKRTCKRS